MADPLRVLFSIGSLAGGGAERQTIQYLRHLDRRRFAPQLLLTYRRGELLEDVPADVHVLAFWDRHRFPRCNYPGRIHRWQVRDLARILDEREIDVLVAVSFPSVLVAGAAVGQRPTPWLAVEMADPRLDLPNQISRFRAIKQRLLAKAYRRATRAVAVSEGVREGLQAVYGQPADRTAVLPNWIDLAEVDRRLAAAGPVLTEGVFHIAAVGRLNVQKGHVYLLQALARLVHDEGRRGIRVHLIGQGPEELRLRELVAQQRLEQHVTFTGYLADPLPYVRRCQLFCLPSLYEGLPLALLEAMACGVPILAADCPSGPREVLDGGAAGRLVPAASSGALAEAIADAMDHPAAWQQRVSAARLRVEKHYSAGALSAQLEQLIERAAGIQPPDGDDNA